MRHRILIVDDEQAALNLFSSVLKDRYLVATARTGEDALAQIQADPSFAVVLADIFLPGISGIEVLAQCAKISPETVRISLTGDPGRDTVVDSVNQGNVFRFVSKPIRIEVLHEIVDAAVQRYDNVRLERDLMDTTVRTSVNLLLEVLATLDPPSFGLSQRLRGSIRLFARELQLPNAWELELAASLARIGTVALPAGVLRKVTRSEPLSAREAELAAQVPQLGAQLLKQVPRMDRVAQAIRYQAKNFDGSGPPADSVARSEIPLGARLLRIFTDRALLESRDVTGEDALRSLASRRGFYDPTLLEASFVHFPETLLQIGSAGHALQLVPADQLKSDVTLAREIRTSEGLLLVAAGTRLTPLMIQRIQTHLTLGTVSGPFSIQRPNSDAVVEEALSAPHLAA